MQSFIHQDTEQQLHDRLKNIESQQSEELLKEKARLLGIGYIQLRGLVIPAEELRVIPEADALSLRVLCFYYKKFTALKLACTEYSDAVKKFGSELARMYRTPVNYFLVSDHSFEIAVPLYRQIPVVVEERHLAVTPQDLKRFESVVSSFDSIAEQLKIIDVSEAITLFVAAALKAATSDMHFEEEEKITRVRFRVDGLLHTIAELPFERGKQLVSRIKLISGLKINVTDVPQDGHFEIRLENEKVDIRTSSLPTEYGESIVMRILRSSGHFSTFEELGMFPWILEAINREIKRPAGMLTIVGPTGSGKTTTLYAAIHKVNVPDKKIITIEDPIEYELGGINQSEVNEEKGYTFAKGLRSLVRQDPDVILIGEIRDIETVDIALQAALTGHLVFTTIHSNDTASALPRFFALGAKPYLLAPAANAFFAQRLVRKVCASCKAPWTPPADIMEKMNREFPVLEPLFPQLHIQSVSWVKGRGCDECQHLGYRGRTGIFEYFPKTYAVEKKILAGVVSEIDLRDIQREQKMITLFQDGILKALLGITSPDEVLRVVDG